MNRDVHEGEVGIAVYHYGAELNQVEEELFIPMKSSYEYLKEDMELLSYVTRDDMLYVILEDDLYQIDIKQKSFQIVKKNDQRPICGSQSLRRALPGWIRKRKMRCTQITVMSLEQGDTYTIQATVRTEDQGTGIYEEDLVYGIANDSDIVTDNAGNTVFP